jgi:hypothetical protein
MVRAILHPLIPLAMIFLLPLGASCRNVVLDLASLGL